MDLSRLVAPEGEKTVLMVGEIHKAECPGEMLDILHAFKPDAVAIEYSADRLLADEQLNSLLTLLHNHNPPLATRVNNDFTLLGLLNAHTRGLKSMPLAAAYAGYVGVPLYLADWQPTPPSAIGDWFTTLPDWLIDGQGKKHLTQKGLVGRLEDTIATLFGKEGLFEAECHIGKNLHYATCRVECEETYSTIKYDLLCQSPQGIALRNEYQAMVLNSLPGERILYVGGAAHCRPKSYFREIGHCIPNYLQPVQHLVRGRRYYIDLPAILSEKERASALEELGTDEFPMEVTKTIEPRLEWERLGYWREGFK